ncbi:GNAT family N-acetyltransferase [Franzmannia qiaohouensis]|uniref:GNAT family N-acetyltransferase n=1 Tax=Franzmannia qiaohouensis TaxID=1329370 RepID=A0ABU1HGR3_9GAMM|nr:GNAT family N-acetyltransferase [Halomonas qiaohouensis]MDR5906662.1 GNAT family N-acetyltransferase [Halomonas qiaohouensis]
MSATTLSTCQGHAIAPYLDALARLRIRVFRDFPYLYDGDLAYESDYLARYADCPRSLFVLAFDADTLVGAATGMPLADDLDEFRAPFEQAGFDIGSVFYYGESVLLPSYRGRGIGKAFMAEREAHARGEGFASAAFCAVERPDDHPLKPHDYVPLHGFWRSRGYERHPELATTFHWKDIGDAEETHKPMVFWLKSLR